MTQPTPALRQRGSLVFSHMGFYVRDLERMARFYKGPMGFFETDRGLLVVCDPRLRQMNYGARLRAALPPMAELHSEAQAFDWLADLAAAH